MPQNSSIHLRLTNYLEQRDVYDAYNFTLGDVVDGSSVAGQHDGHVHVDRRLSLSLRPQPRQPRRTSISATRRRSRASTMRVNGGDNRLYNGGAGQRRGVVARWQPYLRCRVRIREHSRRHQQHRCLQRVDQRQVGPERPGLNLVYAIAQFPMAGRSNDLAACQAASSPFGTSRASTGRFRTPVAGGLITTSCRRTSRPAACPADYGVIDSFIGASSFHPGGVNVLLMDGSVRFVKSGISLTVWQALGTRAGGEVISADAY